MKEFEEFLQGVDHPDHREQLTHVLQWIADTFPQLKGEIKWNIPMFTEHGTFILGFSVSKHHFSVSPEVVAMREFTDTIEQAGYSAAKGLFRIPWDAEVDYALLEKIIVFNMQDKATCTTFWRK